MAKKVQTVDEALMEIQAKVSNKTGKILISRFNKKKFNTLMLAIMNDADFSEKVVSKFDKETGDIQYEDIMVSKGFRKWCKSLLEKVGVDSMQSEIVMDKGFKFDNVDGLYEFFASALYRYMNAGNRFDLLPMNDFSGSLQIQEVPTKKAIKKLRSPSTGDDLGEFEITNIFHKEVRAKGKTPKWLIKKKKK